MFNIKQYIPEIENLSMVNRDTPLSVSRTNNYRRPIMPERSFGPIVCVSP